jgi:hypothetical protein
VVRVLGYRSGGPGSIPGTTRKKSSGSGTRSTQPREYNWGPTWQKSNGSCLENREYGRRDPSRRPRGTLYPRKLAITSPTSGGLSVGIVRSWTQTMEFFFYNRAPRNLFFCFWYSFQLAAESTPGPQCGWKDQANWQSNDLVGNRTHWLPACSAMPQPTALPLLGIQILYRCVVRDLGVTRFVQFYEFRFTQNTVFKGTTKTTACTDFSALWLGLRCVQDLELWTV